MRLQGIRFSFITLAICVPLHDLPAGNWSGSVSATIGPDAPLITTVTVSKRDLVSINVSGNIYTGCSDESHGPEGSSENGYRDYGYTCGILMVKLSEHHVPIEGGAKTFVAPHNGPLYLYINDDRPGNNRGAYHVNIVIYSPAISDADEDGVDDELEDRLLDFYAPNFRYDIQEERMPCDAWWFLRNSQLESCGYHVPEPATSPFYAEWFLGMQSHCGPEIGCQLAVPTSILDFSRETCTRADIGNAYTSGQEESRVLAAQGLGLYGHVVSRGETIILQYWQLYAFNDIDIVCEDIFGNDYCPDLGEHEGDWELVEVVIDRAAPFDINRMREVRWFAHKSSEPAVTWRTPDEWVIRDGSGTKIGSWPPMPAQHVPIYVEWGSHGFWPTVWKYNDWVGSNDGDGIRYTPSSVQNVGEVYRPRLGMEIVLHFNGRWGKHTEGNALIGTTTPAGPILQSWAWPDTGPSGQARYLGQWDHGSLTTTAGAPKGKISWPHQTMAEAAAANVSTPGRIMLIYPGSYPGVVTISTPTELRAAYGPVTIGE